MGNSNILIILTLVAVLLIFLFKRRKWKKEIFTGVAPGNIGLSAVVFFKNFLAFLPEIGAEAQKGQTPLDGSILIRGKERGAYIASERGGLMDYLGLSLYFSYDPAEKHFNSDCENLMFFALQQFIKNKSGVKEFFKRLAEGVLAREDTDYSIETETLKFRCSLERDYSESDVSEIPELLRHIPKPVVITFEVMPAPPQ